MTKMKKTNSLEFSTDGEPKKISAEDLGISKEDMKKVRMINMTDYSESYPYNRKKTIPDIPEVHICPVCQSVNTTENATYDSNGVMGPGYHSWKTSSHYYCKDCGVMFHPIKKDKKL